MPFFACLFIDATHIHHSLTHSTLWLPSHCLATSLGPFKSSFFSLFPFLSWSPMRTVTTTTTSTRKRRRWRSSLARSISFVILHISLLPLQSTIFSLFLFILYLLSTYSSLTVQAVCLELLKFNFAFISLRKNENALSIVLFFKSNQNRYNRQTVSSFLN